MSEVLQAAYAKLCQELGDLSHKKSQIQSRIELIEKELSGLSLVVDALSKSASSKTKKDLES